MRFDRKRLLLWLMVAFTATPVALHAQGSAYPPGPGSGGGGTTFTGGTITAPLLGPTGCGATPAYSFEADTNAGMCLSGADSVRISTDHTGVPFSWLNLVTGEAKIGSFGAGSETAVRASGSLDTVFMETSGTTRFTLSTTALTSTLPIRGPLASESAPTYSFSGFTDSGMYTNLGLVNFSVGGVTKASIRTGDITSAVPFLAPSGTESAPGVAFSAATGQGFYNVGSGFTGLTSAGVQKWAWGGTEEIALSGSARNWSSSTTNLSAARDTGLARNSAGIVGVTNGGAGSGQLDVGNAGFFRVVGASGNNAGISQPSGGDNASIYIAPGGLAANSGFYRRGASVGIELYAGTPFIALNDAFHLRAAAGVTQFSASSAGTTLGYVIGGQVVEANATTKAAAITESGELYTNTGDADGSIINLPNDPTIGTQFRVALTVAQTVTINAAAGESIQDAGTNAASRAASAIGDSIHLIAVTGGSGAVWMVVSKTGTWS